MKLQSEDETEIMNLLPILLPKVLKSTINMYIHSKCISPLFNSCKMMNIQFTLLNISNIIGICIHTDLNSQMQGWVQPLVFYFSASQTLKFS